MVIFNIYLHSLPLSVDFQDGVKVWWDGSTRAYIDAPASYRGKTLGLCGTFNSNMQDDFLTPEGTLSISLWTFYHHHFQFN